MARAINATFVADFGGAGALAALAGGTHAHLLVGCDAANILDNARPGAFFKPWSNKQEFRAMPDLRQRETRGADRSRVALLTPRGNPLAHSGRSE
jgi:predicted Rdx family selenoprotein